MKNTLIITIATLAVIASEIMLMIHYTTATVIIQLIVAVSCATIIIFFGKNVGD